MTTLKITDPNTYVIQVASDGTTTSATLFHRHSLFGLEPLAVGSARRRKGDKRNEGLGVQIALLRLFEDAAESVREEMRKQGFGAYVDGESAK